jgi:hypothetical protein
MIDSERFELLHGPYVPPKCRVGDKLPCEQRGREVIVGGMTDAPIQWPYELVRGPGSPILCGDLIRAVWWESASAVAHHWGVDARTVENWRQALDVTTTSEGLRLPPPADNRGEVADLLAWAEEPWEPYQPYPARRSERAHPHHVTNDRRPSHNWTEEEIARLGRDSDGAIAGALGLPKHAVANQRRRLRIPARSNRWPKAEIALLGTDTDTAIGRQLGKSPSSVRTKRRSLGIPGCGRHWPAEQIARLGTDTDAAIAQVLNRPTDTEIPGARDGESQPSPPDDPTPPQPRQSAAGRVPTMADLTVGHAVPKWTSSSPLGENSDVEIASWTSPSPRQEPKRHPGP